MTLIRIPKTTDEVVSKLTGIGTLITAKEWERAALVATVVRIDQGHGVRGRGSNAPSTMSAKAFARLGIHGLRSHHTVAYYVEQWLDVVGSHPEPGSRVELPDLEWPPAPRGTDGYNSPEGAQATIERIVARHGPEVVVPMVRRPEVARAVERDVEASTALVKERLERSSAGGGGSSPKPSGGLVGMLEKVLLQIGAMAYSADAEKFRENVLAHDQSSTPWKPAELAAIRELAENGIRCGQDVIAVLDAHVTDEGLAEILGE